MPYSDLAIAVMRRNFEEARIRHYRMEEEKAERRMMEAIKREEEFCRKQEELEKQNQKKIKRSWSCFNNA